MRLSRIGRRFARLPFVSACSPLYLPPRVTHRPCWPSPFLFSACALSNLGYRQQPEEEPASSPSSSSSSSWGSLLKQGREPVWGSIQQQEWEPMSGSIMQQQEAEAEEEAIWGSGQEQQEEPASSSIPMQLEEKPALASIRQGEGEPASGNGLRQQQEPVWVQEEAEQQQQQSTSGSGQQSVEGEPASGNGLKQQQEPIWVQEEVEQQQQQSTSGSGQQYNQQQQQQQQGEGEPDPGGHGLSQRELQRFLRLTNVEAVKQTLSTYKRESIACSELLSLCRSMGVASSRREALAFMQALDEAGVVFTLRDRVYLNPQQIVDIVVKAVPIPLLKEEELQLHEFKRLRKEKDYIDKAAHKHVRVLLWSGLGYLTIQAGLFFRFTYWDLSWDAVEPMAFFITTSGFIAGYLYFLWTSSNPTYHNLMHRVFQSKQRKLMELRNFDNERFLNLEKVHEEILRRKKIEGILSSRA